MTRFAKRELGEMQLMITDVVRYPHVQIRIR